MFIGYIQLGNNIRDVREQDRALQAYGAENSCMFDIICRYDDFGELKKQELQPGDVVVVSDISRLGNSLAVVRDNICFLAERGVSFVSICENYEFVRQDEFLSLLKGFDLVLDIRARLASALTTKALREKKQAGQKLGRLKGTKVRKVLDGKVDVILKMLNAGMSQVRIASSLNVSRVTLYNFIKSHDILKEKLKLRRRQR